MKKLRPIPHISVPVVDQSGKITEAWYLYFLGREKVGLSNLSDVSTAEPSDGQSLVYNATLGGWEPQ